MIIYLIIFVFFLYNALHSENKSNNRLYYSECIILILLYGLRYRIGGDSLSYEDKYGVLPCLSDLLTFDWTTANYQPGWYVLNALVKLIGNEFYFFQITHAIIINVVSFAIIKKYCQYKFTAVLLYYFFISPMLNTEVLREAIAVAVFMLGYDSLIKRKWIRYYVFVFLAFMFHNSAIFLVVLPLLFYSFSKKWKLSTLLILFVLACIISIFSKSLFLMIINNLSDDMLLQAAQHYSMSYLDNNSESGLLGMSIGIRKIILMITSIMSLYLINKLRLNNDSNNFIVNIELILAVLSIVLGDFMSERLGNYFIVFYLCVIATIVQKVYGKTSARNASFLWSNFLIVLLIFNRFLYYTRANGYSHNDNTHFYDRYIPYYSVFNPQKDKNRENIRSLEELNNY